MTVLKTKSIERMRAPWPLETLGSYLALWRGSFGVSKNAFRRRISRIDPTVDVALTSDPDFPDHPEWAAVLSEITHISRDSLLELGRPIGPWHLKPSCRVHACLACLEEQGSPAQQSRSKMWTYATFTACWIHDLPLIDVPAIGWEWADLSPSARRAHATLVHTPGLLREPIDQFWRQLDANVRRALYFAEMSAWVAPDPTCFLAKAIGYDALDQADVWEDLLALLCSTWSKQPGAPLSVRGIPNPLWSVSRNYFGSYGRSALDQAPTMNYFCSIESTFERRAAVLTASLVTRPDRVPDLLGRSNTALWKNVLKYMPDQAFDWLKERAVRWPRGMRERLESWEVTRRKLNFHCR
jgi:hypothetical protein